MEQKLKAWKKLCRGCEGYGLAALVEARKFIWDFEYGNRALKIAALCGKWALCALLVEKGHVLVGAEPELVCVVWSMDDKMFNGMLSDPDWVARGLLPCMGMTARAFVRREGAGAIVLLFPLVIRELVCGVMPKACPWLAKEGVRWVTRIFIGLWVGTRAGSGVREMLLSEAVKEVRDVCVRAKTHEATLLRALMLPDRVLPPKGAGVVARVAERLRLVGYKES